MPASTFLLACETNACDTLDINQTPGHSERLIDWGSRSCADQSCATYNGTNNIVLGREGLSDNLIFQIYNRDEVVCSVTLAKSIVQNDWMAVAAVYNASTKKIVLFRADRPDSGQDR